MRFKKHFVADVAIIGGGPVGLFAAFEAGMLGLSPCIIETLPAVGGQCSALYPEKPIYDIPAHPSIKGNELTQALCEQVSRFSPNIITNTCVQNIAYQEDKGVWYLRTNTEMVIEARSIIVATGGGAFKPNRPPINNIAAFENRSVFYAVKQKESFKRKTILIAGGGDSAVDWALELAEIAEKIYLVHRREDFRCIPGNLDSLKKIANTTKKIEFIIPFQLESVYGNEQTGGVESVVVVHLDGQEKRMLDVDALLLFFGLSSDASCHLRWNVALSDNGRQILVDHGTMQTSIKGVYAIGDVSSYPGKLKLILTGFAEAALACRSAYRFIYPDRDLDFKHSTSLV